jgi:beta-N-acetylhexosaminidase
MRAMLPRRLARSARPLLAGIVVGLVAVGLVVAVRSRGAAVPAAPAAVPAGVAAPAVPATTPPAPPGLPACGPVVAGLAPRDRLAQRLVVGVDAARPDAVVATVRATRVGGVFLGGNATALLRDGALRRVQAAAQIPVSVAVDDEGGRVQRVDALDGPLPSARRMARLPVERVRELGRARGEALAARGVTVDFGPVVDVGDQPAGAVIGDRSFSADPAVAARYAGAFAEGLRAAGVLPVFKHFPGHGRASGDSHKGRVTTPPLDRLRAVDLRPYTELLPAGAPPDAAAVMVGHLDVPGLTDGLPTSLTPQTYRLLRGDYGFDGLVVTDDLGAMKAVTGTFALPEAVLRALAAGADAGLWSSGAGPSGADATTAIIPVLDLLESALADGRLDAAANDRAVTRVLAAKGVCA